MKMRHAWSRKVAGLALVAVAMAVSGWGAVLNVPQRNQERDQWCWCASSQMILLYYGKSYTQTAIANWAVGGLNVPNFIYGSDATRKGVDLILRQFGSLSSSGLAYAMPLATLTSEMNAGRPAAIRWGWDNGGGHILVAHGTSGSTVYLRDPWPANGPTVNTYAWVVRGGGHTWTHSLKLNSSTNPYYAKYLEYLNAANYYAARYRQTGAVADIANYNYCLAHAAGYYFLSLGQTAKAYQYYYYYLGYAYKAYGDYYFYYHRVTRRNVYAGYGYYNYAYYLYYNYLSQGKTSTANYYFNLCMAYARWYWSH